MANWQKFTNTFFPTKLIRFFTGQRNWSGNILNEREAVWIDVKDAWKVYCTIPHLTLTLNMKAEMLSNMRLTIVDKEGNEVEGHEEQLKFLNMPNPLQSFKEWISQLSIMEDLYGNGFIYPLIASRLQTVPKAMWNLPSGSMKINKTGKLFDQYEKDKIIKNYEMDINGTVRLFKPNEVWHTNNNDSPEYFKGASKLEPIRKNLSNIDAVLKTANVLYAERGGIFMFSHDSKGEMGAIPLSNEEKAVIEKQYREDYGIHEGQKRFIITKASMKATPISFPIKDLMMFEELESDFGVILGMYGMDRDLFPSTKGATNENKEQATKLTYQNTIQPAADDKARVLTDILKLNDKGLRLKASFDHLPVFQEDEQKRAQVNKTNSETAKAYRELGMSDEKIEELLGISFK